MGKTLAAIGIVINVFLPGVGTLVMGKWKSAVVQLGVLGVVWMLKLVSLGILGFVLWPVTGIVWLWALIGGFATYADRALEERDQRRLGP